MGPDRMLARCGALVVCLIALETGALAQSATCRSMQNELSALMQRGGTRAATYAAAAQRQVDEIQRISAYMRQIGCGAPRLFIFGPAQPAQCAELAARLSRMQANFASLQGHAEELGMGPGGAARRDQLKQAIRDYCGNDRRQALPPWEQPIDQPPIESDPGMADMPPDTPLGDDQGTGSGKPICVRLCDGYFFPLASVGRRGPDGTQEMCQAQCPGSETEAFTLGPEGDIAQAVGQGGKAYMELDNALRYQKATVPGCSCRKSDQSWGEALKGAEDMLGGPDTPISAEEAARLSRPAAPTDPKKPRGAAGPKGQPAPLASGGTALAPTSPDASKPGPAPDPQRKVRIIVPQPSQQP